MFKIGDYYYSHKNPIWIEIIDVDPMGRGVEFMKHRIDTSLVEKDWWTAMSLPIPFDKHYGKADSEAEARIKSFEIYCKNNLDRFEEKIAYILEPLVTVKVKKSDLKWIEHLVKGI